MAIKKQDQPAKTEGTDTNGLDSAKYVNLLVSAEMEKDKATKIVDNIIKMINQLMPKASVEERDHMIMIKLRDVTRTGEAEKFRATIIALDDLKDQMGYLKYVAREAYKKDKVRAVAEGVIIKEGDKIVEMDTRKFVDKEKTKPNKNYGKKLPTIMRREAFFIIDGKLIRGYGNFEAEVGRVYDIYGFLNDKDILNVAQSPAPKFIEDLSDKDLWELASGVLEASEMAMDLVNAIEQDKNTHVITHGTLQHQTETGNGDVMMFLGSDEVPTGVACFAACDSVGQEIQALGKGSEVIIIGRIMKNKGPQGEERTAISVTGIIQDPKTSGRADVLSQLDEAIYE